MRCLDFTIDKLFTFSVLVMHHKTSLFFRILKIAWSSGDSSDLGPVSEFYWGLLNKLLPIKIGLFFIAF